MRRALAGALLATAAAALLLVGGAGPVAAHTETGTFSATRAEPSTDGTYTIDLLLTYDNDGHGAEGAALTVTVQGPTGGPVPVAMAPGDRAGAYTGDVAAATPGEYTVTAASTDPEAATTFTFTVEAPATTTTAATATTDTAGSTGTSPVTTATTEADDSDTSPNVATIVANVALLAIGAAAAFFGLRWWRRRRDTPAA